MGGGEFVFLRGRLHKGTGQERKSLEGLINTKGKAGEKIITSLEKKHGERGFGGKKRGVLL